MKNLMIISLIMLILYGKTVLGCTIYEYVSQDEQGNEKCFQACYEFVNIIDGVKYCQKSCSSEQFISDPQRSDVMCLDNCSSFSFIDDLGFKRCSSSCPYYQSSDNKECNKSCPKDEFISEIQQNPIISRFQCLKSCEPNQYIFTDESGNKFCMAQCPQVISSNNVECASACNSEEYLDIQTNICVTSCDPATHFPFTNQKGIKLCSSTCMDYVDDSNKCIKTCPSNLYLYDKQDDQTFQKCSATCNQSSYELEDGTKRCGQCPSDSYSFQGTDNQYYCEKKTECKNIISIDSKSCIESCDQDQKQYVKQMNGYKQCAYCDTIYDPTAYTCKDKCEENEVYVFEQKICISQTQVQEICIKNYRLLSTDEKTCSNSCVFEVASLKQMKCLKQCDQKDFLFFYNAAQICDEQCMFYETININNQKECTRNCVYNGEASPSDGSRQCIKCQDDEFPLILSENLTCYKIADLKSINPIIYPFQNFVNNNIPPELFSLFKKSFEMVCSLLLNYPQFVKKRQSMLFPLFKFSSTLILYQRQFFTAQEVYFGSNENILISLQNIRPGYQPRNKISIDSIQKQEKNILLQPYNESTAFNQNGFGLMLLAKNPACTLTDCSSYPVITIIPKEYLITRNFRMLQTTSSQDSVNQDYTATYTVKDTSNLQKYVCLSYDLSNLTANPKLTTTTIENDNKSITCLIDGDVQLYFDEKCIFVDKSLCPTPTPPTPQPNKEDNGKTIQESNSESDEGLSNGEIAGIIIGSIAFAIIVSILIYCFIRRKNVIKQQQGKHVKVQHQMDTIEVGATEQQI